MRVLALVVATAVKPARWSRCQHRRRYCHRRRCTRPLEQMPALPLPNCPLGLKLESSLYPLAGAETSTVVATGAEAGTAAVVVDTVGLKPCCMPPLPPPVIRCRRRCCRRRGFCCCHCHTRHRHRSPVTCHCAPGLSEPSKSSRCHCCLEGRVT